MTVSTKKQVVDGQEVLINVRNPDVAASPRCIHTGNDPASISTDGNDTTPSITETYFCELYVPESMLVTGISVFNGSAAAGNITAALYRGSSSLVAGTITASTAQAGTDAYQNIPFTAPVTLLAGTYYVALQFSSASARFNSHLLGAYGAGKMTGTVYGTMPSGVTVPTTFTANLGPFASLY